jgi:hypothetical protein
MKLKPSGSNSSYDLSFSDNPELYNGVRTSGDGQYVLLFDPDRKVFVLHQVDSTFDMNLVKTPAARNTPKATKAAKAAPAKAEPKRKKAVTQAKKKPPVREPTPEEEDSDDGLTIEYPGAPSQQYHHQSTPTFQRHISEEISDEDEDEDAEGEEYEEKNQDVDYLKLPSPGNIAGGMSDEDMELDLEAELEQALKETAENDENESSESEEE